MGFGITAYFGFSTDNLPVVLSPDLLNRLAQGHTTVLEWLQSRGSINEAWLGCRGRLVITLQRNRRFRRAKQDDAKEQVVNQSHGSNPVNDEHIWQVWYVTGPIATGSVTLETGDMLGISNDYEAGLTSTRIFNLLPGSKGVRVAYLRP